MLSTATNPATRPRRRPAFTLVELLVVIAIIGILVMLLMPAVSSARESGRRIRCRNHLKQIATAARAHETLHGHFPTGGWGFGWVGDPDRGFGTDQPGGFFYNILPFMEQQPLHDLPLSAGSEQHKKELSLQMVQTPLQMLYCPSRRPPEAYPVRSNRAWLANTTRPPDLQHGWYRSDYAVNGGTVKRFWGYGPGNFDAAANGHGFRGVEYFKDCNGLGYQQSRIPGAIISDGLSQTYLVGEKYLNPDNYLSGIDYCDDEPALGADDYDLFSWTDQPPKQDRAGVADFWRFGSVHSTGVHVAMCGGSIQTIAYSIDPLIHARLGSRNDGEVIPGDSF